MPYCPQCGVELAAEARKCPLCGSAAIPLLGDEARGEAAGSSLRRAGDPLFDPEGRQGLSEAEMRKIIREILSVSTFIASLAVCGVNLLTEGNLSWALYPLASLVLAWIILATALIAPSRPVAAGFLSGISLLLYLFVVDIVDGSLTWSMNYGIPIALVTEVSAALALILCLRAKRKGLNVIAWSLLGANLSCLGIDATLSLATSASIGLSWSGIVSSAIVPVSIFLLYLHYRVTRVANLRRLFRL